MPDFLRHLLIVIIVPFSLLGTSAMFVWAERRLLGLWQQRYGPNRVGPFGIFQVVADMLKIFFKEDWLPPFADRLVFIVAPSILMITSLTAFAVIPFTAGIFVADLNIGVLFVLAMLSLGVYGVVLGGWASQSKYPLMGGVRAVAQLLSYEVFMGISLMGVVMMTGSFNLSDIVEAQRGMWFCIPQFFGMIPFVIAGIAEAHRLPFDLPEAESELVAGYHTEYSGMKFGLFFVGEYIGILLISSLMTILFFGGWLGPVLPPLLWFMIKTLFFSCCFFLLRASLPRPRYDQLMETAWKRMLPLSLANLVITAGILLALR